MEQQMELSFNYQNHSEAELLWIPVIGCQAHPLNPRLSTNDEQVERIAGQIQVHGYKPEHAIIVRPVNEGDRVLDPFAGSGTTGVAVIEQGGYLADKSASGPLLIEQKATYIDIIRRRVREVCAK